LRKENGENGWYDNTDQRINQLHFLRLCVFARIYFLSRHRFMMIFCLKFLKKDLRLSASSAGANFVPAEYADLRRFACGLTF
jgi:hypothetical protein